MRLLTVPSRQGVSWVRRGFQVFLRQPLAFCGLFACFLFVVFLLTLLPFVGPVLLLALLPLGSLGFMIATRVALQGRFPLPRSFVEPLRSGAARARAILILGIVYAVCSLLIIWLSLADLQWDDPDLAITWPISPGVRPLLSDKDARGHALAGLDEFA